MRFKPTSLLLTGFLACASFAENRVVDGQKVVCEDGVCMLVEEDAPPSPSVGRANAPREPRLAQGYMRRDVFFRFLRNGMDAAGAGGADRFLPTADKSWWLVLLLALFGGLCMNLTPCVLPMVPINLMIVGKSAARGALYGLGIALAYGAMGLLAALGGLAFGEIQGSPWFNAAVAALFAALGLALMGVFHVGFSKRRAGVAKPSGNPVLRTLFPFAMGAVSAVLAGACVAPVLIAVLLLTADWAAQGHALAFALPFVLGFGMALPWPFAGAGLKVLPKPGAWMTRVNKAFGLLVFGFAAWYGRLAWTGFAARGTPAPTGTDASVVDLASPADFKLDAYRRPVLVDCWASWCKNCAAMDRGTLRDPAVRKELENYTVVRLRAENLKELKALEGFGEVKGLPAFLVFGEAAD